MPLEAKLSHVLHTTLQVHWRLLWEGSSLQEQFIGMALAPNLFRNSRKQLSPEVPSGHDPSNVISFGQKRISPVLHYKQEILINIIAQILPRSPSVIVTYTILF